MTVICSCHGWEDKHSRTVAATLERPRYSTGLILEESDLTLAVEYSRSLSRMLARNMFGCGVICGLRVTIGEDCGLIVNVAPGLAIDGCGDAVEVPAPIAIKVEESELIRMFTPPRKAEFWVVLCGGEKLCAPRFVPSESGGYDPIAQPTRIRSLATISLAFAKPECCRHDHDRRAECAPDCGCGTACACGCCLLLAHVVAERNAAGNISWEVNCTEIRDGKSSPPAEDPSASSLFIWQSGNVLDPYATHVNPVEVLQPAMGIGSGIFSGPDRNLKSSLGLLPLHRRAQLQDISLLRFADSVSGPPYNATIKFDLVIMDFNGVWIRTISTTTLDYRAIPLRSWTPITLSTRPGDLDVIPGQLVAGQLTFGAPMPTGASFTAFYQLSGTGRLM